MTAQISAPSPALPERDHQADNIQRLLYPDTVFTLQLTTPFWLLLACGEGCSRAEDRSFSVFYAEIEDFSCISGNHLLYCHNN